MQIFFGRLVTWLAASVLTIWTGYKTFFLVGFLGFLSVALYSLFLYGIEDILGVVLDQFTSIGEVPEGVSTLSEFTGLGGWFLARLKVPECLAVVVDMILLKWMLRKIPFIKW